MRRLRLSEYARRVRRGHEDLRAAPRGRADAYTLAVIDFEDHRRGGHFGAWLRWFTTEFAARFDYVTVVTPNPRSSQSLFAAAPANVSFERLPKRFQATFDLGSLFKARRGANGPGAEHRRAFVMWGYDLLSRAVAPSPVPWAALGGMSWHKRGNSGAAAEMERELLSLFAESPACSAFFQPDGYLLVGTPKAVWIPDVEDVALPARLSEPAATIRERRRAELSIGAFGNLYGRRCVDELLRLAQAQPGVQFVLAGKLVADTVDADLFPLLEDGALPNLVILPGFIEGEENLNAAIDAVDGVFIDGANYPVQSGIVCRALHFGKWLVTSSGDSWTSDLIADKGTGLTYQTTSDDLFAAWVEWKASGGERRSRKASEALRDPVAVAAAFDAIAERLIHG